MYDKENEIVIEYKKEYSLNKNINAGILGKISLRALVDIFENEKTKEIVKKITNHEMLDINIYIMSNSMIVDRYRRVYPTDLYDMYSNVRLNLSYELQKYYDDCFKKLDFNYFALIHSNDIYEIRIDNIEYKIKVKDMMDFFRLSLEEVNKLKKVNMYKDIPLEHFAYATRKYLLDNNVTKFNFVLEDSLEKKIRVLAISSSFMGIDISAINVLNAIEDDNYRNIKINKELEEYILKDMPSDFDKLEKAIYIYIKLCQTLTYDEEYYAFNQQGVIIEKHKDPKHIEKITLDNNEVVCYEFNAIFGKLLTNLGINYKTIRGSLKQRRSNEKVNYAGGHEYLKFRIGNKLYSADSVTSILRGDLFNAKLKLPLEGFKCLSNDSNDIASITLKVYTLLDNNDNKDKFSSLLKEYNAITSKKKKIKIMDKVLVFNKAIVNSKLTGIDLISYMLHLKDIIFSSEEQERNIDMTILKENIGETAKARVIFTYKVPTKMIEYYYFEEGKGLITISKEDIIKLLNNKKLEYIDDSDHEIKGIRRR